MKKPNNVDEYIALFPKETQKHLKQIRAAIKKTAPSSEETISYGMPAYKLNGVLVYFAGYNNHVGFYPTASGIEAFQKEIAKYKWAKGSVQFPLTEPMPLDLVSKMTDFRVKYNLEKKNKKM